MTRYPPSVVITPVVEVQAISIPSAASQHLWEEFGRLKIIDLGDIQSIPAETYRDLGVFCIKPILPSSNFFYPCLVQSR